MSAWNVPQVMSFSRASTTAKLSHSQSIRGPEPERYRLGHMDEMRADEAVIRGEPSVGSRVGNHAGKTVIPAGA